MDFLMSSPKVSLGEVAQEFGVTQPWLSCIIHSDAFQSLLREKQNVAFHHTVLPIREKMLNVAHQALDKLVETLPFELEPRNLSAIAGDVLDRLGFTSKVPTVQFNQQNNHVTILREEIDAARALLGAQAPRPAALEVAHNGERTILALPHNGAGEAVQRESLAGLGPAFQGTALQIIARELGQSEAGNPLREESPPENGGAL